MKKLKTYTIPEALEMIKNKRGAGVSKETKIKIEIDIKTDISRTQSVLATCLALMMALSPNVKSEVTTEMENNPDWEK
jgi:hypothetical protein